MKQSCVQCQRLSPSHNLWCQEVDCPIGQMPTILSSGESFADLQIVKLLAVLQTAAIYEATRAKKLVLLKISHDGAKYHERLKREAQFLAGLQERKIFLDTLPRLMPAYRNLPLNDYPYGKAVLNGQKKYYTVFEHSPGDMLQEYLLKTPQPWYQQVGWMAYSLASLIQFIHDQNKLHLCLSPEVIQLRFDDHEIPRIKLLDLGALTDIGKPFNYIYWDNRFVLPAYIAPEMLLKQPHADEKSDLYAIGLILYELLNGHPAYPYRLRSRSEIQEAIQNTSPAPIDRGDLQGLPEIAKQAIRRSPEQRQNNLETIKDAVKTDFFVPPEKKKSRQLLTDRLLTVVPIFVGVTLLITLLITILFLLTTPT